MHAQPKDKNARYQSTWDGIIRSNHDSYKGQKREEQSSGHGSGALLLNVLEESIEEASNLQSSVSVVPTW